MVNYRRNVVLMVLFVSFITASVGLTVPTASAGIPAGMVSYWKLDENIGTTAYDYLGTYDGTNNGATINQPGQVGTAYSFDGVDDYVDMGDIGELNSVSTFTIVGWINHTDNTATDRVFDKIKDGNNDISIAPYWGRIYFEIGNGGNTYAYWNGYSSTIPSGQWYHLAAVFDGSGATNTDRAKIYVNGVERSLTFSGSIPSSTADLSGYSFSLSRPSDDFDGVMDEVAIFNNALSASEILDLYNKGLAGQGYCWPPPVGGVWLPINKTELLTPWIGLASLITGAVLSLVYVERRKKQRN